MNKRLSIILVLMLTIFAVSCSKPEESTADPIQEEDTTETVDIQTAAHLEKYSEGNFDIEFVIVTGLPDETIQNTLNENIKTFYTWETFSTEERSDTNFSIRAEYSIIGNRYISVRAIGLEITDGAAYPTNTFTCNTFDLSTGEGAGSLADFVELEDLKTSITDGKFIQVYPDVEVPGALESMAESLAENTPFYLSDNCLGIILPDQPHAVSDYNAFEAKYNTIISQMTAKLSEVVGY